MTTARQQFIDNYPQGLAPKADLAIYDSVTRYWWLQDAARKTAARLATLRAMPEAAFRAQFYTPGVLAFLERRLNSIRFQLAGLRQEFAAQGLDPEVVPVAPPPFERTAWGRVVKAAA